MSAPTVRASNSLALLGPYNRQMWSDIAPYLNDLPQDIKEEAREVLLEGERSASEIIGCAMGIASTGFRQLAGAVVLRRQGWLKATTFRPEVPTKILDRPYDGQELFGKHIDEALQGIKKDTDTAKTLGTLQYKRTHFRGARGKSQSFYRGGYQQYRYPSYTSSSSQQYRTQFSQRQQPATAHNKSSFRGKAG